MHQAYLRIVLGCEGNYGLGLALVEFKEGYVQNEHISFFVVNKSGGSNA